MPSKRRFIEIPNLIVRVFLVSLGAYIDILIFYIIFFAVARLHELKTFTSENGSLTVFEEIVPGVIQRVFYIYEAGNSTRAGHRHQRAWNALVCLTGSCRVYSNNGREETEFQLTNPRQCLVLEPQDWHVMDAFSEDAILLVVSNELYDKDDYIYEAYPNSQRFDLSAIAVSE